jgi:hypothetical protein
MGRAASRLLVAWLAAVLAAPALLITAAMLLAHPP